MTTENYSPTKEEIISEQKLLKINKQNKSDIDALMQHVKAPDFPTGGVIYGYEGVRDAFHTGRGRIVVRAKAIIEEVNGRECIIVSEIPYQVNKADMIKKNS